MSGAAAQPNASLFNPPFVVSAVILAATAIGLPWATKLMKVALAKDPVPLRRPLWRLDRSRLGPYEFVAKTDLEPAVVEALGTEEYIYWFLEDTDYRRQPADPRRFASLAVTYYTGQPDPVPHVSEVCMVGAGYTAQRADSEIITVGKPGDDGRVPVRAASFVRSGLYDRDEFTVVYTFHCNGRFAATRNTVRRIINDPRDHHAYYSKVEVTFGSQRSFPQHPPREDTLAAAEKLLGYVLPVLIEEHWPDWDAVQRGETTSSRHDFSRS